MASWDVLHLAVVIGPLIGKADKVLVELAPEKVNENPELGFRCLDLKGLGGRRKT